MKKIITSLSIIGAIAAIAVGGTMAFFTDTETSTGNTFTAGGIDLTVDSFGATYNGQFIQNGWLAKDLVAERFFDLSDVKPGDQWTRNLSLHVENNPAWVCLYPVITANDENGITNPEAKDGDTTASQGELPKNVHVLVWRDYNPDNRHGVNEPFLIDSFFDVFTEVSINDSTTGTGPLRPTVDTEMIAMDLCAGTHVINTQTGAVSCNGTHMDNQAQTDSLMADMKLYVEQSRNNPNFKCSDRVVPSPTPTPITTQL